MLAARRELELVIAHVGIRSQMAHIGDVDDMADLEALPPQHPLERVGEDVGPHVLDVLVCVDGRAAGIHADLGRADRSEIRYLAGQRVEQPHPACAGGHGPTRYAASVPPAANARGTRLQDP